jgi:aspartyl-tRNA synthetase
MGGLLFIDLRDHYGITQCVIPPAARLRERRPAPAPRADHGHREVLARDPHR